MNKRVRPAERLENCVLADGWRVVSRYVPKHFDVNEVLYSCCYIVEKGDEKGFLKAFDYSDLQKAGGRSLFKIINHQFDRELGMLKRCNELNLDSVIKLKTHNTHFFELENINERVDYFILEYSENDNLFICIKEGNLKDFKDKFEALYQIFDGLENLHSHNITHLDIKATNLVHFMEERITKITDFGCARTFINYTDEDLLQDLNVIGTTRHYAPPEFFYDENWTNDFNHYRKKIDLYLAGNLVVKLFANISFTTLLKSALPEAYNWDRPHNKGRMKQYMPFLIKAASDVYVQIDEQIKIINESCGSPLNESEIDRLMLTISELCDPNPLERGHPKEIKTITNSDGLYRYRDRFLNLKNACAK